MKKLTTMLSRSALLTLILTSMARADATTYFTLPATFSDDTKLTITTAFTVILVILAVMFAIRKTTKTVNKT